MCTTATDDKLFSPGTVGHGLSLSVLIRFSDSHDAKRHPIVGIQKKTDHVENEIKSLAFYNKKLSALSLQFRS